MTTRRDRTLLAGLGSLLAVLALGGAAFAATLPSTPASTHASGVAVLHAAGANADGAAAQTAHQPNTGDATGDSTTGSAPDANSGSQGAHGALVSVAAQSSLTGGAQDNHGGYVSCVARGGTGCDTTTPTLPSHGQSGQHGKGH